ncbi:MAG: phosphohistidine phosphatase SixA [Verrucomicrobia bacterium]|nr:phosphohistidine phosphatase SixA [Verrucomicrobiota bacterium]
MNLLFLRHADAVAGRDDARRPLSTAGKRDARRLARFLQRAGIRFDAAYSSPLVRARQTAEIVLAITQAPRKPKLSLADALLNEATDFAGWLESLPEAQTVLLVGHAPSLGERVCGLLGVADASRLKLAKGGLACLETDDRRGARLKFLVSPKVL